VTAHFISYAQNFEDVMLWRALKHVERGFYIDVGAYSPTEHSVTEAFYQRGWRGINVEPQPDLFAQFLTSRPRDINVNVALSERAGQATMSFISGTGLSTLDEVEAEKRVREGWPVVRHDVEIQTIDSLWARYVPDDQPVHFLKIDVEGFERQVLQGNDWLANRPWIVVVEATRPLTSQSSHGAWESILRDSGYAYVYGDGLNRFYLATERSDLGVAFEYPPNFFDDFVRSTERQAIERATKAEARAKRSALELAQMRATRSWRLTRPLRAAAGLARRVRAALINRGVARAGRPKGVRPPVRGLESASRPEQSEYRISDLSPRAQAVHEMLESARDDAEADPG
jgi:FkbM family methyltransferase